ncbi:hypothetical protein Vretimale_18693 [Volvox reticuliferus]|uniref:Uncharacterized protein n=1 Tax=Volvox reticuliferus TaxID=1737510 RepID=A0A8J4D0R7_9CHLO|nr:hypothetical protein Vretifemale_17175 [Volvox reticuliferus]GIM16005.1 hypothetical protein Vretimale_18693 [Volvox reticuliferus]
MKPDAGGEKTKNNPLQNPVSNTKATGQASPPAAGSVPVANVVVQLGRMSHADLMALAHRHNNQLGLVEDVLAAVMRDVGETTTVRPPAVHSFTLGGGPRKNEYQAAWKSLSKRVGIPLPINGEVQSALGALGGPGQDPAWSGRTGRQPSAATAAAGAAVVSVTEAAPPPTHAQMYGSINQPLQQVTFAETLASWLGVGPIELPLLTPGAPPLPLRRLFLEVLDAGGSERAGGGGGAGTEGQKTDGSHSGKRRGSGSGGVLSWGTLAGKLQGDEKLGDLLKQVYDAYLLPLEKRLPRGTRPGRVEAWMQEDLRRRGALLAEQVVPTVEQVTSRLKASHVAIMALLQQHQQQQCDAVSALVDAPAAAPANDFIDQDAATAGIAMERDYEKGTARAAVTEVTAVHMGPVDASSEGATIGAIATAQSPAAHFNATVPLAREIMHVLRVAAVAAPTLLPGVIVTPVSSKRARAANRKSGKGSRSSSKKRARGSVASAGPEGIAARGDSSAGKEGTAGMAPDPAPAATTGHTSADAEGAGGASGGGDGSTLPVPDLVNQKASVLLGIVASLRELRAGPPGCATQLPDLRANFMARWEMMHARAAAAAAAAAALAAAPILADAATISSVAPAGGGAAAPASTGSGARARQSLAGGSSGAGPANEEEYRLNADRAFDGGVSGVSEVQATLDMRGMEHSDRQMEAEEDRTELKELGRQRVQQLPRGLRQQKRQRKLDEEQPSMNPPLPMAGRQRAPEQSADPIRRPKQPASLQRGGIHPRQKQPSREPALVSQQRERPPKGPTEEWRRSSPYLRPPAAPHYQTHRAAPSAIPLMSAAASTYDSRLPPRPTHRPPASSMPPPAQQHLDEMRRYTHARNHPYNSVASANVSSNGDYYDRPSKRDPGRFDRGPGGGGQGGPGRTYMYPRQTGGGEGGGGWDDGTVGGSWGYGAPRGTY